MVTKYMRYILRHVVISLLLFFQLFFTISVSAVVTVCRVLVLSDLRCFILVFSSTLSSVKLNDTSSWTNFTLCFHRSSRSMLSFPRYGQFMFCKFYPVSCEL